MIFFPEIFTGLYAGKNGSVGAHGKTENGVNTNDFPRTPLPREKASLEEIAFKQNLKSV